MALGGGGRKLCFPKDLRREQEFPPTPTLRISRMNRTWAVLGAEDLTPLSFCVSFGILDCTGIPSVKVPVGRMPMA